MATIKRCAAVLLILSAGLPVFAGEVAILPLKTNVKVLPSPAAAPAAMAMQVQRRPVPTPTTPGGKLPQYQLGHQQRKADQHSDANNPKVRFFLALPKNLILIEATITIDDLPFRMPRERQVDLILKEMSTEKNTEAVSAESTTTDSDSSANVLPATIVTSSIPERLRHTMKVTGEVPSRDEVHWILNNWVDGPVLLQLNNNFQRFRANQRPGFAILDRDRNGTVSIDEMRMATQSFQECDLNRDEIIQFTEVAAAAADPRVRPEQIATVPLVTFLPDEATAATAYQRLAAARPDSSDATVSLVRRVDTNGDGEFDADELQAIRIAAPDLSITISFNTSEPQKSSIAVMNTSSEYADAVAGSTIDATGINLKLATTPVNFVCVQAQSSNQISIGAVNDGYPILPVIDPNDDGRLTIRELRGLSRTLNTFDTNHDGVLTIDEVQAPIRICFGLGPIVHKELAGIRNVYHQERLTPVAGPEWFVRMDRNKDNDLTRGEFPGTDDQFQTLDADADQLISAQEALEFDRKAQHLQSDDDRAAPVPPSTAIPDLPSQQETKP